MTTLKTLYQQVMTTSAKFPFELELDNIKIPFVPGKLMVIGSRPGMGRTLLMLYLFAELRKRYREKFLFISNEEDEQQLYRKLLSTVSGVVLGNQSSIKASSFMDFPFMNSENDAILYFNHDWETLQKSIIDSGARFVFIDKFQGIKSNRTFNSREEELDTIAKEMKAFVEEKQLVFVVSTNLDSDLDLYQGHSPKLCHIKECSALEEVSDIVLLLIRWDYYDITEDEEGNSLRGVAYLNIAKNRLSPMGNIRLAFNKKLPGFEKFVKYDNWS